MDSTPLVVISNLLLLNICHKNCETDQDPNCNGRWVGQVGKSGQVGMSGQVGRSCGLVKWVGHVCR